METKSSTWVFYMYWLIDYFCAFQFLRSIVLVSCTTFIVHLHPLFCAWIIIVFYLFQNFEVTICCEWITFNDAEHIYILIIIIFLSVFCLSWSSQLNLSTIIFFFSSFWYFIPKSYKLLLLFHLLQMWSQAKFNSKFWRIKFFGLTIGSKCGKRNHIHLVIIYSWNILEMF